jgi:hypothetical protein
MKMADQWDPKWPKEKPQWDESYDRAKAAIEREAPWNAVFTTFVTAYDSGELAAAVARYQAASDPWDRRLNLWNHVRDQIFVKAWADLPGFAKNIWGLVPATWVPLRDDPAVASWPQPKLVTFKTTVLYIAGLLENRLPASLSKSQVSQGGRRRVRAGGRR